jgi:hypothetical protein
MIFTNQIFTRIVLAAQILTPNVTHHSVNFISLFQQQLSQVVAVLPSYSSDQSAHANADLT